MRGRCSYSHVLHSPWSNILIQKKKLSCSLCNCTLISLAMLHTMARISKPVTKNPKPLATPVRLRAKPPNGRAENSQRHAKTPGPEAKEGKRGTARTTKRNEGSACRCLCRRLSLLGQGPRHVWRFSRQFTQVAVATLYAEGLR